MIFFSLSVKLINTSSSITSDGPLSVATKPCWHVSWHYHGAALILVTKLLRFHRYSLSCHKQKTQSYSRYPGGFYNIFGPSSAMFSESCIQGLCCWCISFGWKTIDQIFFKFWLVVEFCVVFCFPQKKLLFCEMGAMLN